MNPEEKKEYKAKWYRDNRDRILRKARIRHLENYDPEKAKVYRKKHAEKIRACKRRIYHSRTEEHKQKDRERRNKSNKIPKNREAQRLRGIEWRKNNQVRKNDQERYRLSELQKARRKKNPELTKIKDREEYNKYREQIMIRTKGQRDRLDPKYIRTLICARSALTHDDVPDSMVSLMTEHVRLRREVRNGNAK